jgi:hypothetical protein
MSAPVQGAPVADLTATAGGQGSFSYADTKVFGPRQQRQAWAQTPSGIIVPTSLIYPGTGGGAKAPGRRYYGSRAVGFNPNGLVLLRLMKLE